MGNSSIHEDLKNAEEELRQLQKTRSEYSAMLYANNFTICIMPKNLKYKYWLVYLLYYSAPVIVGICVANSIYGLITPDSDHSMLLEYLGTFLFAVLAYVVALFFATLIVLTVEHFIVKKEVNTNFKFNIDKARDMWNISSESKVKLYVCDNHSIFQGFIVTDKTTVDSASKPPLYEFMSNENDLTYALFNTLTGSFVSKEQARIDADKHFYERIHTCMLHIEKLQNAIKELRTLQ